MLGIANFLHDRTENLALPPAEKKYLEDDAAGTFSSAPKQQGGPTIMVVGDSFTGDYFPPLIIANGGRIAFVAHKACGFDWTWIGRFRPDEVWWMPTERLFLCWPGLRPKGLPETDQARHARGG
jgi:hypothetical protein